ncbi:MAG: hypothetical protein H6626_11225 [Pseudobdellovibrionaceae bacterium]|nr:hypothetical protein [Bdellovibrionales bacterium]USN46771.1 MAG: hypothetical protein H6626_11225 [Pseudobdellovibrionaceae bacterium]
MSESNSNKKQKKKYKKPQVKSEDLMTFGASCNGMATGGRKSTAGPPDNCNASKLLS